MHDFQLEAWDRQTDEQTDRRTASLLNKSVLSFLRTLTTWHYPHSPDARRAPVRRAAIDRYLLPANRQQQTCSMFAAVGPRWDRQTDGQTDVTDGQVTDAPSYRLRVLPITTHWAGAAISENACC